MNYDILCTGCTKTLHTCIRKSDVASLKIIIFKRFKNIDFQRSYGHFPETGFFGTSGKMNFG